MHGAISEVACGNQPVTGELFLKREIPLLHVSRFRMEFEISQTVAPKLRELDVHRRWIRNRERIACGSAAIRIRKASPDAFRYTGPGTDPTEDRRLCSAAS